MTLILTYILIEILRGNICFKCYIAQRSDINTLVFFDERNGVNTLSILQYVKQTKCTLKMRWFC